MAGELVLLTGATGFVGFATLVETLRHGYKVRAAVRSEQKAETVRSHPTLKDIKSGQLGFIIVPDFLAEGAFDEAVKDVTSIIHLASPIPGSNISGEDDLDALMVQPAIEATLAVFRSAQKVNNVKRIVVTSSAVALMPFTVLAGMEKIDKRFGPDDRCDAAPSPYMHNTQVAYIASKTLALKHAEEYIRTNKPSFDVIHIHPSLVLGRDELVSTSKALDSGSNSTPLGIILGRSEENGFPATVVHIKDVAVAHVRALDSNVPGNQSFLLSNSGNEGYTFNTMKEYVQKHFPEAVSEGLLPNNGSATDAMIELDTSKTEEVLGIKFKSFEEMTIDLVGQYLELLRKEKGQQMMI